MKTENGWLEIPLNLLLAGDYEKVTQFYEALVEQEPDNISFYWYLGLGYLLMKEEDQAQLTWFMVLNEFSEDALEQHTQDLTRILDKEGDRQEAIKNHELAWLIRGHIRELSPTDLNNLLKLIWLDIKLEKPTFSKFDEWNIINLLNQHDVIVSQETLLKTMISVINFPTLEGVGFAKAALKITNNSEKFALKIIESAGKVGFDQGYPIYAVDLTRACLEQDPENLVLLKTLFWFYANAYHFDEALEVAEEFSRKSVSLSTQVFGSFFHLYIYLLRSDWIKVIQESDRYIQLLRELSQRQEIKVEKSFIQDSLIASAQLLIYIRDTAKENRYFNNLIGKLFQDNFRTEYSHITPSYSNSLISSRPLKIGYIGHTFRNHSVGWLSRWLIHYREKDQFQTSIYAMNTHQTDSLRSWFQENVDKFHVMGRDIEETVKQIQADEIDILVDMDSLTLNITCQVMALKPAPIQVTWLGQDASGIPAIDYFIADPYVLPDDAESYYSEKIWRLPQTYLGIDGFEIGVPTLRREDLAIPEDAIIYMNFQGALKRYPDTIRLQFRIVKAVPNSYFLIKGSGDKAVTQHLYQQLAAEADFPLERIRFLERDKTEIEHRANLQLADVVLDTYPYNGATTTLEVLWSGIPLVTKVGQQFAARNSYTFMVNAGISEGIAWTDEEYIEWGIRLGTDENLRKEVSWKLRQSRKTSPLWNGKQFARDMENAYRQMWEIYVRENQS
jgi:predicted O-linked N-acetylglucosamine transferase (SPINDLY family)